MKISRFNIRVYGIYINDKKEVLVTDEYRLGTYMTKFPGGGLEFGEGTLDCLRREIREELGQEPFQLEHFYTTDFFQPSWLVHPPAQLISIYYLMTIPKPEAIPLSEKPYPFGPEEGAQAFRFLSLDSSIDNFTFPVDKVVWKMLQHKFSTN
ncbi:MAG: hypothetical protein PWR20_1393 [Bacteroidales bacterium]|jgi:ADP-ribose pyrophosphatase YjhB (NUDIX family)|nr:hypothetical protein [Bacteroidales bacterium]MDN5329351.1 hypothetical protein [Bacteroidales bacterium]